MRRSRMTLWALLTAALLVLASVSRDAPAQRAMSHGQAEIQARKLWSLGDAVRRKGQYDKAVKAYEKSLEVLTTSGDDRSTLGMAAKQMIEFCNAMPIDVKQLKDGAYEGEAWGYFAVMKISLKLEGGRIREFRILQHKETREKGLEIVPRLIVKKQSPSVDAVSRATVTSYGLMTATLRALQKAESKTDEKDTTGKADD